MRKRIIALLTAFVMLSSMLPMTAAAVSKGVKEQIVAEVTKTVESYAKSVNRANADDDAFWQYVNHGFYGNGSYLTLKESDPMVASLFNSKLYQKTLIDGISEGIFVSQKFAGENVLMEGGASWHQMRDSYSFTVYLGETDAADRFLNVFSHRVNNQSVPYTGPMNEHDDVMHWLVGGLEGHMHIRPIKISESTITYDIELNLWDSFDFHNNYNYMKDKGYDVSKDDKLRKVGLMMTYLGLDEFEWGYDKHFTIEVPYECNHQFDHYAWHRDYEGETLREIDEDGVQQNTAVGLIHTYEEKTHPYYELEKTVFLRHDRPWVVESTFAPDVSIGLMACITQANHLNLRISGYSTIAFVCDEFSYTGKEESVSTAQGPMWYVNHCAGVAHKGAYTHTYRHEYTCRIENVVESDGSNMVYVTIVDDTLGEVVYGPSPMTSHWTREKNQEEQVQQKDDPTYVVGKDLYVNYVGNGYVTLGKRDFDVRIWENGKDGSGATAFVTAAPTAPTCTAQGFTVHTCRDCGYSYTTDLVPALGHSFGEYVYDSNASCTSDGTQTRTCTVCGEKETITAPDTATGHSYTASVVAPTYTEQGYTTYTCHCGDSYKDNYVDVKKHSYEAVVTAATCIEQGYTTYTCTECGDSYVADYTELADHTPVIDPAVAPTCVEKGKTEGSHCGVCGEVLKKQALISTVQTHNMESTVVKEPAYDAAGLMQYTCKDCGISYTEEIPPVTKPASVNPFSDVSETDWFYAPVLWAVENKVTGGKTEATFAPYEGCTRAQVVTFLWAANGKPAPTMTVNPFADISAEDWFYDAVLWAVGKGITTGISNNEFGPNQVCTRAQIATFLWAANGKQAASGSSEFVDVADSDWFAAPVIWAKENDITGGIGNGMFGPNDTCTRAQVVTFLKKAYS